MWLDTRLASAEQHQYPITLLATGLAWMSSGSLCPACHGLLDTPADLDAHVVELTAQSLLSVGVLLQLVPDQRTGAGQAQQQPGHLHPLHLRTAADMYFILLGDSAWGFSREAALAFVPDDRSALVSAPLFLLIINAA